MGLEEKFDSFAIESSHFQGEVRSWMKTTDTHLAGVHEKINKHIENHAAKAEQELHEVPKRWRERISFITTTVLGLATLILGWVSLHRGHN